MRCIDIAIGVDIGRKNVITMTDTPGTYAVYLICRNAIGRGESHDGDSAFDLRCVLHDTLMCRAMGFVLAI